MKKIIVFLIIIVIISSYTCNRNLIYHDNSNPCTTEDSTECNKWKAKYPKDYNRYLKRMKLDSNV